MVWESTYETVGQMKIIEKWKISFGLPTLSTLIRVKVIKLGKP